MLSVVFFFIKVYMLVKFIDEPSPQNYLLFIVFLNLFFFGYTWAFYVTLTCLGLFLIEDWKRLSITLMTNVHRYPYLAKLVDFYKHPTTQICIQSIKYNGDQLVAMSRWIITSIIQRRHPEPVDPVGWLQYLKKYV